MADGLDDRIAAIAVELGLKRPTVAVLPGGLLNRTLRLQDAKHDVVLRLAGAGATALGVDRDTELAMQQLAASAGLAPAVLLPRHGTQPTLRQAVLLVTLVLGHVDMEAATIRLRFPAGIQRFVGQRQAGVQPEGC